ncbi:MAG: exo-alpha-sialidase [Chloroflexi bacterium]|nr:exo-alpha-sialidase [Chloroflexota bacterium]
MCGPAERADPNLCPADCADTAPPLAVAETAAISTPAQTTEALPDELVFIPDPGIRIDMASQPAPIVAADGAIYVFYTARSALPNEPNSDAVARSTDGLTFTELGLDPNSVPVINPFATLLPNGVWRLYDFDMDTGTMTSRSSQDGIHFVPDEGVRYTAPAEHLPIGVRDFYVNSSGDVILLYVAPIGIDSPDHHIRRAVSTDGGDTFVFHSDNVLGDRGGGELHTHLDPKFVELPVGGVRLITMVQGNVPIPGQLACCKIYSFTSADGYTFTQDPGVRLQTSDFTDITVWSLNDPWVILLPDGRFRMYVAALVDDGSKSEPFWAILSATTP